MAISFDALREGVRNIFLDESHVTIKHIGFKGNATFSRPGDSALIHKEFSLDTSQDELTLKALTGMINGFDRKNIDLIIEGLAITPEYVHSLQLKNLEVRAVFVGFVEDRYLESLLKYAYENKDWIYTAIQENNGDDTKVREWFQETKEQNKKLALAAKEYGYGFFPVNNESFDIHIKEATDYLLKK